MNIPTHVLVVDDDELVRNAVVHQLGSLGVPNIATAAHADEAKAVLRAGTTYQLIISDLLMPGGDGVELLRELGALQPDAALILMSSMDAKILHTAEELARTRGLHVLGALPKPIGLKDLRTMLEALEPAARRAQPPRQAPVLSAQDLRQALAAGEIDIYVQPQVEIATGQVSSAEVLARWISPVHGLIMPDRFIALAEREGLMEELTLAVLERAARACADWRRAGFDIRVSVNVSITSFDHVNLPEVVLAVAQRHGLEPKCLMLEVTESAVAANTERMLDTVTRLRMHGILLSIDDFGTGYASIKQLRQIPFSELKGDRSFVSAAVGDEEARSILESTIGLAHKLHLSVVAEGVETAADFELLRQLGCDYAQGYFIARPFPKDELPRWLAQRPPAAAR